MYNCSKLRVKRGHPIHGFVYIPDPEGHRYNLFHLHPASKLGSFPPEFSLSQYRPPIWDQDGTGSCVGHGTAGSQTTTYAAHGMPLSSPANPRMIYTLARAIDRVPFGNGTLPPLIDQGAWPNSAARALVQWGLPLEEDVDSGRKATSPDYSDYLSQHVNDEPGLMELEDSGEKCIPYVNSIGDRDRDKIHKMCLAIASGHAPMGAVEAGSDEFQGFSGNGVLDFTGNKPDHWIYFDAYRTNTKGEIEFELVNSWGIGSWTPTGTAWVTTKFVREGTFNILLPNI